MRMLTKGFKANDLDLELGSRTLLIGPNGSGKSTASDALRFLALGYVPHLGKRPIDSAALMSGDEMTVALMLDDGRIIQRKLKRNGDKLEQEVEVSWLKKAKTIEGSKAILQLFGTEEADAAECLDIRILMNAKPNERASRIEQLMASTGVDSAQRLKLVDRYTLQKLIGVIDERMPEDPKKAEGMVAIGQMGILKSIRAALTAKLKDAGLGESIEWANDSKRAAAIGLKNRVAAQKELAAKVAGIPEPSAEVLLDLRREAGKLQRDIGGLEQAHRTYLELKDSRANAERSVANRKKEAAEAEQEAGDTVEKYSDRVKVIEKKELPFFDKVIEGLFDPGRSENKVVEALRKLDEDLEQTLEVIEVPEVGSIQAERDQVGSDFTALETLKASPWSEVLEISEGALKAKTTGSTRIVKDLKAINKIAKKQAGSTLDEAEAALKLSTIALDKVCKQELKEMALAETAQKEIETIAGKLKDVKTKLAFELKADQGAHDRRCKKIREKRDRADTAKREAERELDKIKWNISSSHTDAESAADQLEAAQEIFKKMRPLGAEPTDPEILQAELKTLNERVTSETEKEVAFKQIKAIVQEIEHEKAEVAVWEALESALKRVRGDELSSSSGRLLRFIGQFLKAAGRDETPFVRASQGFCSVGWKRKDGREVQAQALSGGEWCIFAAAITSSVVLIRRSALKLLLIEAGEGDANSLTAIMNGIDDIEADGGLTASLVMTHADTLPAHSKDWKVINVGSDQRVDEAPRPAKKKSTKKGATKDGSVKKRTRATAKPRGVQGKAS